MAQMVIEVPEVFREVGEAMAETLATLQRTLGRTGGGKAVDYAEVERVMSEEAGKTERAAHRAILQALDIDVPAAVVIGGFRYTRVGRCEASYPPWSARSRSSGRCTVNPARAGASRRAKWSTR